MTPEEFCKVPDELAKLLKEIEDDKNNNEENNIVNKEEDIEEDSLEEIDKKENKEIQNIFYIIVIKVMYLV